MKLSAKILSIIILLFVIGWQQWQIRQLNGAREGMMSHILELLNKDDLHDLMLNSLADATDSQTNAFSSMQAEVQKMGLTINDLARKVSSLEREVEAGKPVYIPPTRRFNGIKSP